MTIIITESQYKALTETQVPMMSDKIRIISSYLDRYFMKSVGTDGNVTILRLNDDGKAVQEVDDKEMFYILQDEMKNIAPKDTRDRLIIATIKDWYFNGSIKNGILKQTF